MEKDCNEQPDLKRNEEGHALKLKTAIVEK
jgi:hypothetical protein